ncbi:hypothetical protein SK128_001847 [Halocaridina rubra]|uniref:EndoU domain-containing protein n=1 Tax=Halocaridina rubra TaxID=373956 RepID=A0AAN9A8Q8_HALRR
MKKIIFLLVVLCGIASIEGCNRGSTSTTTAPPVEEPEIESVTRSTVSRGSGGSRTPGSGSSTGSNVSANEIRLETEKLLELDAGGVQVPMRPQGKTSSSSQGDSASQTLFAAVPDSVMNWETTRLIQTLLDNYEANAAVQEDRTSVEQSEEDNFLNALMRTEVMKELERYLKEKGYLTGDLRSMLKEIWFTTYKRAGRHEGSSGFEHVFVGELKGGKVSGFHNWLNFRKEEQEGDLDYKGYMRIVNLNGKGQIIKLRFDWLNEEKTSRFHVCGYDSRAGDGTLYPLFHDQARCQLSCEVGRKQAQYSDMVLQCPRKECNRKCLPTNLIHFTA